MKIQTDSEGFLIGGKREDFRTLIAKSGDTLKEVRLIRKMLEARRKGGTRNEVAQPAPRRRSGLRSSPAAPRDVTPGMGYGEAAARGVAAPQRRAIPGSARQRDAQGRYVADARAAGGAVTTAAGKGGGVAGPRPAGSQRGATPAAAAAAAAAAQNAVPGSAGARDVRGRFQTGQGATGAGTTAGGADAGGGKGGKSRLAAALRELKMGGGGDISQVDPLIAATREISEVVGPIGRAFGKLFGRDPEKKKAAWFKRIFDTLKKLPEKIGERVSINVPGNQAGGGIGDVLGRTAMGGMGLMKGLLRRTPVIGAAMGLAGSLYSDSAIASDGSPQRRDRLSSVGRTAGTLGGAALGGLAGFAFAGPLGAAIGVTIGPMLVRSMTDVLSPLMSDAMDFIAETSSKIADLVMNGVGWLGQTSEKLMTLADYAGNKAKEKLAEAGNAVMNSEPVQNLKSGTDFMKKLAHLESTDNPASTAQRDKYLAGTGKSTASGRYQFIDSTFASELERNGASIPAAADLVGVAKSYNADKRGTRAKARDPAYKKLFDAKLDPAIADPLAEFSTERNRKRLAAKGITSPTDAQLYSVHFTGNTKAAEVMQMNPSAPVSAAFSKEQIKGNEGLFASKSSVGDVFAGMDAKLNRVAAVASVPTRSIPKLSPAAPMQIPEAPRTLTPVGSGAMSQGASSPQQETGQDMKDRNLALIQTGGLGK